MPDLALTPPVFTILSALVEERIGVSYSSAEKEIFESKVAARVREAGFESMLDYYYYLRYDDPEQREFEALAEALLVHETFFFRELDPLRVAVEHFVAPLVAEGRRPRVWSAACSTGEEIITFAMLLEERGLLEQVELLASDLSEEALRKARQGRFSPRALRHHTNHPLAKRYLVREGDELHVPSKLLRSIDFRQVNLVSEQEVAALSMFDVILCRNVLIYFRDERARVVLRHLTDRLVPNGAMFVGVSESLMRFGGVLRCEEHGGAFVYCKRSEA